MDCDKIESHMKRDMPNIPNYIPYIQRHEFEALLFTNLKGFDYVIDDPKKLSDVNKVITKYDNPEDINGGSDTAPSKRLENIFSYKKTFHSIIILSEISIDEIRSKCPRFNAWVDTLLTYNYR